MTRLKQSTDRWDRKLNTVSAAYSIFLLLFLAFLSDRALVMKERRPAMLAESGMVTDADGKQHYVDVVQPDPSLREALDELFAFRLRIIRISSWGELLFGGFAFCFLTLYFRTARIPPIAFREEGGQATELPQSAAGWVSPRKPMEGTLAAVGLLGLAMALAVVVLWVVILWLDWRGALESVAGRALTITLSGIAAKTALGSGICSLVFFVVTEWRRKHMRAKRENDGA